MVLLARQYQYPRTEKFGAIGPLREKSCGLNLGFDGLGAARGQRFRKGPCASHPTRQISNWLHLSRFALPAPLKDAPYGISPASIPVMNLARIVLGLLNGILGYSAERIRRRVEVFPSTLATICAGLLCLLFAWSMNAEVRPIVFFSLRTATIDAFGKYLGNTESQNSASLQKGSFLWVDGLPEKERNDVISKLKAGDVETRRLSVDASGGNVIVPGGMIHDWEGIVFVPGVKIDDVLRILQDYDHQATYYAPDVEKARIESRDGNDFRVFLRFRRHKVVTVVLDTEHAITYYRDSPLKAHSRSSATRIAQVEDPGRPNEKEKAPGDDDGYLWRMETWWRMEERDGGVYVQNQAVTLTRDIPTGLGWLIEPFITKIPKETLEFTLQATRSAVLKNAKN
jgi:hypothetical protein